MKSVVVLFACIAFSHSVEYPPSRPVATLEDFDCRVTEGSPAQPGQFPYQVYLWLVSADGDVHTCGGSIIHPQWVLTAAHCVFDAVASFVIYGTLDIEKPELILFTNKFYPHFAFDYNTLNNDIALIDVGREVPLSDNIQPIVFATRDEIRFTYQGMNATLSGFGRTANCGDSSDTLNYVNLVTLKNSKCKSFFDSDVVINSTLCAISTSGTAQSTCNGESGGPLVVYKHGDIILIGIASFVSTEGCDSDNPTGYTRPYYYHDWLTDITGIEF